MSDISQRKIDHLELCLHQKVEAREKTTCFDDVELIHQALPGLNFNEIDTQIEIFGKTLKAPLLISGMTGGAQDTQSTNFGLARVAQTLGIAFGLGSQRPMLEDPSRAPSYCVRDVAPDILLFANIGAVQAKHATLSQIQNLVETVDANALAIHLNPAQEMMQPEGDRDFTGLLKTIEKLCTDLQVPVIIKETGCGLSQQTLTKLNSIGVKWVDTAGRGGTTWTGVEALRNPEFNANHKDLFWDWGIPTAASIIYAKQLGFNIIGSGGIRNGLDVAKAIALGAKITGMALPWLKAYHTGGTENAIQFGNQIIHTLKIAMTLTACKDLHALTRCPTILGPSLTPWLHN